MSYNFRTALRVICMVWMTLPVFADPSGDLHLKLQRPHQLRDLFLALQTRNWFVSFEEGPVLSADDLESKISPTGMNVVVRRTIPMSFDLTSEQVSTASSQARVGLIRRLLASYASLGNRDSYRVDQDGGFLHVIPTMIVAEDGSLQAFEPILATKISFPEQRFETLYGLVEEVLNLVAEKRGVSVVLGEVPTNLFRQSSVVEAANHESAQQVLARAFAEINGPRLASGLQPVGLPWTLVYDPTNGQYWFSVGVVKVEIRGYNPNFAPAAASQQNSIPNPGGTAPHLIRKSSQQ